MTSAIYRALRVGSLAALLIAASVVAAAARDGGGTGGSSAGSGAPHVSSAATNSNDGQSVAALTRAAEAAIGICGQDDRLCLADALDGYAAGLRKLSPPLAPELRALPEIVSRAARQIRQAKTRVQAAAALKVAIAAVHKTIALLKADDPVIVKAETRQGALVAETLAAAENKLEKAVGL